MRRLRPFITAASIVSLLFLAAASVEAITPTPSPTPTPDPLCVQANLDGGGSYAPGAIEVMLPAGKYGLTISPPGPSPSVTLCHHATTAIIELRTMECAEVRRVAPSPEAGAVVDAIVGSCRVAATATPGLPPHLCPNGDSVAGNQTITIADAIRVALPEGEFVVQVNGDTALICNPSFEYSLAVRLSDCGRSDIAPPDAPVVLAQIAGSCVVMNPVVPATVTPSATDAVVITPPSTGNAGLRAN